MEKVQHPIAWYYSDNAKAIFEHGSLQQKVRFLQCYLSKLSKSTYTERAYQEIFRMRCYYFALFLADAIYASPLPYGTYPECIDPKQNPFLSYWNTSADINAIKANALQSAFEKILREADTSGVDYLKKQIREKGEQEGLSLFYNTAMEQIPVPDVLAVAPELRPIHQKIHWLCNKLNSKHMVGPCRSVEVQNNKRLFFAGVIAAVVMIVITNVIAFFCHLFAVAF